MPSAPSDKSDDKINILIIDDERGIRNLLSYDLQSRGYNTDTACDGAEGIEKARTGCFNVVISDVKMPKIGGFEVLEAIKKINRNTEVIMTTGYGTIDMAVECMKKGAYDFITKPYNMDELNSRIQKALEKQKMNYEIVTLKELNHMKSEFLANTSHELRTPMNAIIGYTTLMLDEVYGGMHPKQRRALRRINANAENLLHLINNILDVSKLSTGKIQLYIESFSVTNMAREVVDMMDPLAKEKGLSLQLNAKEEILFRCDKTRLRQIFINLIGNAIKFTEDGSVEVSLELKDDENIRIKIKDTGIGIDPDKINAIFEEFRQADASTTRKFGGTGLGLTIVKKITEILHGSIEVESAPGKGSCFCVTLPKNAVSDDSSDVTRAKTHVINSNGLKEKKIIVLIDDDREIHGLVKKYMNNTGYVVLSAFNWDEGVAMIKQYSPFAVVINILMPHGWSAFQSIKKDPRTRAVPVFIMNVIENKELGYSLGITDCIIKPFKNNEIIEKLKGLEGSADNGKKDVLIVEGDKDLNMDMAVILKKEGYNAVSSFSVKDTFEKLQAGKPGVVILDLMMEDMKGFEILDEIESDPVMAKVKVIVLAPEALTEAEMKRLGRRSEAIIYKNPKSVNQIIEDIQSRLEKKTVA